MADYDYNVWSDPYLGYATQFAGEAATGALNYAATKETNESNERINAANNERIIAENQKNRDFEERMWRMEAEWNDPSHIRQMLEEAGINPYASYGQQVNTPSHGTPSTHATQPFTKIPNTAIGDGLARAFDSSVNAERMMAAARKDNAEATSTNIANVEYANRLQAALEFQGLHNQAQQIENEKNAALNPLIIEGQKYQNEHTQSLIRLNVIQQKLQEFDLDWMKPSEYFRLQEDINLMIQKQKTEEELREHYRRMDRNGAIANAISSFRADTERRAQQSQAGVNTALVKYYNAAAGKEEQMRLNYVEITGLNNLAKRMKMTENDIYQQYAHFTAWYNNNILMNRSKMSETEVKKAYQEYLMNEKKLNWYDANQVVNTFIPFKYAFGKSSSPQTGEVPLWERYGNPYDPQPIGQPNQNGFTPYGKGVFEDSRGWIYNAADGTWIKPSF